MTGGALGAAVPLAVLVGLGMLARRLGVLEEGDERVLNTYVYRFALPALFFVNLATTTLTAELGRFMLAGLLSVGSAVAILGGLTRAFGLPADLRRLTGLTVAFGSLAFFGIPFVEFALRTAEARGLAALGAATISPFGVGFALATLEAHGKETVTRWTRATTAAKRLARNQLLIAIALGFAFSLGGISLPEPLMRALSLLAGSTAPVAVFSLGAHLWGKGLAGLRWTLPLSGVRLAVLPAITFLVAWLLGLSCLERTVLVLLNASPVAVNMVVLSHRYGFRTREVGSLALLTSAGAIVTMALWLLATGGCLAG